MAQCIVFIVSLLALNSALATCPSWPTTDRYSFKGSEVIDKQFGLIWQRCSVGPSWNPMANTCTGNATLFTYEEALVSAKTFNSQKMSINPGQVDPRWRMPYVRELSWLVDRGCEVPSVDLTAFPASPKGGFWTGSVYVSYPTFAWVVYFNTESVNSGGGRRDRGYWVRLVRTSP